MGTEIGLKRGWCWRWGYRDGVLMVIETTHTGYRVMTEMRLAGMGW